MHYSGKVSNAMAEKAGCLPQLKDIGFFNCTGHTSKISAYHSALIDAGLIAGMFVCGSVNDTTVFFAGTEDEVVAKINAIQPKVKKPVPESVIVKMLALRLKRVAEAIGQINHQISVELEWRKTQSSNQSPLPAPIDELKFSDIRDGFKRIVQHNSLGYDRVRIINDAVETFEREEVTPEAIQKAWELYSVNAVMSA